MRIGIEVMWNKDDINVYTFLDLQSEEFVNIKEKYINNRYNSKFLFNSYCSYKSDAIKKLLYGKILLKEKYIGRMFIFYIKNGIQNIVDL